MTFSNTEQSPNFSDAEDFFRKTLGPIFKPLINQGKAFMAGHAVIDVSTNKDGSELYRVNLAGFTKSEIAVSLDEATSVLTVRAETPEGAEFEFAPFQVEIPLSQYVVSGDVSTTYTDGLLTVKVADASARKTETVVDINIADS